MLNLITALAALVSQLLILASAAQRDEKAELEAMLKISRLLHDELARRMLGDK